MVLEDLIAGVDQDAEGKTIWDNGISADIDAVTVIHHPANQELGTPDVRIDTRLNKHMWSKGIRYCMLFIRAYILLIYTV